MNLYSKTEQFIECTFLHLYLKEILNYVNGKIIYVSNFRGIMYVYFFFPFKGKTIMDDRKCFGSVTDYCRIMSNGCELISAFVNSLNNISL